jgi:DNA-binding MarR family transcriptional regulator
MKTAVTETSLQAYHSHDFTSLQGAVLQALKELGESCIADLADYLHLERSTVSARLNELKRKGVLVFAGKRKSTTTGITSEFWRAKEFKEALF